MECSVSNSQPKRKRLKSIIKHNIAGPVRRYNEQRDYHKIFERVLNVYLDSKLCQPYGSSLSILDSTLRSSMKRWTPDTAHTAIDFENATKKALANEPELQAKFEPWFLCPDDERPHLVGADMRPYNRIIQKCAREFLRRGMFPIFKWFRTPQKQQKDFQDAEITES
jgi:hypothetical protein